jgi:hypothetical protein
VHRAYLRRRVCCERPTEAQAVAMPPHPPTARRLYELDSAGSQAGAAPWQEMAVEQRAPFEAAAKAARADYAAKLAALR